MPSFTLEHTSQFVDQLYLYFTFLSSSSYQSWSDHHANGRSVSLPGASSKTRKMLTCPIRFQVGLWPAVRIQMLVPERLLSSFSTSMSISIIHTCVSSRVSQCKATLWNYNLYFAARLPSQRLIRTENFLDITCVAVLGPVPLYRYLASEQCSRRGYAHMI